jgi:ferritin-like metal-binding protein YciE
MPERAMQSMDELFHSLLQDVYYAEKQLLKALPKNSSRLQVLTSSATQSFPLRKAPFT